MPRTAKLFLNGRSQAVRLPADFRLEGSEVFIRQNPTTGDVILSRRPESWDSFFKLRREANVPDGVHTPTLYARPPRFRLFPRRATEPASGQSGNSMHSALFILMWEKRTAESEPNRPSAECQLQS